MAKQVKKEKPQTGGGTGAPDKGNEDSNTS